MFLEADEIARAIKHFCCFSRRVDRKTLALLQLFGDRQSLLGLCQIST
jgi:hypothetical protein